MIDPISALVATTAAVNEISALLTALSAVFAKIGVAAASVVSICSIITKYVRPPAKGSNLETLYNLINSLAQNAGYAENK